MNFESFDLCFIISGTKAVAIMPLKTCSDPNQTFNHDKNTWDLSIMQYRTWTQQSPMVYAPLVQAKPSKRLNWPLLTDLEIQTNSGTKLKIGVHSQIEHIKTHKIDKKFASFGLVYTEIWISKVHPLKLDLKL